MMAWRFGQGTGESRFVAASRQAARSESRHPGELAQRLFDFSRRVLAGRIIIAEMINKRRLANVHDTMPAFDLGNGAIEGEAEVRSCTASPIMYCATLFITPPSHSLNRDPDQGRHLGFVAS
jgi:hypothetical protein